MGDPPVMRLYSYINNEAEECNIRNEKKTARNVIHFDIVPGIVIQSREEKDFSC